MASRPRKPKEPKGTENHEALTTVEAYEQILAILQRVPSSTPTDTRASRHLSIINRIELELLDRVGIKAPQQMLEYYTKLLGFDLVIPIKLDKSAPKAPPPPSPSSDPWRSTFRSFTQEPQPTPNRAAKRSVESSVLNSRYIEDTQEAQRYLQSLGPNPTKDQLDKTPGLQAARTLLDEWGPHAKRIGKAEAHLEFDSKSPHPGNEWKCEIRIRIEGAAARRLSEDLRTIGIHCHSNTPYSAVISALLELAVQLRERGVHL